MGIVNRLLVAVSVSGIVGLAYLAVSGAASRIAKKDADHQIQLHRKAIPTLEQEVAKVDVINATATPNGVETAVAFQSAVQKASTICGVKVEIESVADPQVYISRFTNDLAGDNWKSIDIQMSVNGSFRKVMDLLNQLKQMDPLFEFGEFEVQRGRPSEDGSSNIVAKLGARVIFRG